MRLSQIAIEYRINKRTGQVNKIIAVVQYQDSKDGSTETPRSPLDDSLTIPSRPRAVKLRKVAAGWHVGERRLPVGRQGSWLCHNTYQ